MNVTFEGKAKVIARFEGFKVATDLSEALGGEGTSLNPFQVFLTSVACCSGLFARQFLEKHAIEVSDKRIELSFDLDAHSDLKKVKVKAFVGKDFPAEMETALINTMKACKVKKHLDPKIVFDYAIVME
ncbi:MAG: OsmC family protein [Bacteroidales bacterium]|jgi:ribosomal protein S12 methylthiotransferase accessory factor|nr:OsmC family protein [Bacteroidales bacterium]